MNVRLSQLDAFRIALLFFSLAAGLGLVMRLAFSMDLPEWIDYMHIRHAHSHVALLGWLFAALYLLIIMYWQLPWKEHLWLYISAQVASLGMLITFPIFGYVVWSIFFSTAHIIVSYLIIIKIWHGINLKSQLPELFLKAALVFLFLATLGTWSMGFLMGTYKGTAMYYAAIQWYLHFMFNGWMIFALLAIFFKFIYTHVTSLNEKRGKVFFWILVVSTCLTYALSVTWSTPLFYIFEINSVGVVLQLLALIMLFLLVKPVWPSVVNTMSRTTSVLIKTATLAFIVKILIQTAVVFPFIAKVSYTINNFVIGFVHLLMLGCITLFIFSFFMEGKRIKLNIQAILLILIGIAGTEFFLFLQGLFLWLEKGFITGYYHWMTAFSLILAFGVWTITIALFRYKGRI